MSTGYEIKADLVIAIQTMDTGHFKSILEKVSLPFLSICDHNGSTIFHELASILISDPLEAEFFEIYLSFFYKKHAERAADMIQVQVNKQTNDDQMTPVLIATAMNKTVT